SHLGCLQKAAEKSAGSVLILEDDVDLSPNYSRLQHSVAQRLATADWDMFYGGGDMSDDVSLPGCSNALVRQVPHDVPIQLAHFVAVRGATIPKLYAYLSAMLLRPGGHPEGGPMDVDGAYSWFRRQHQVRTLMAMPELAHQRSSASNITPRWFDQVPGLAIAARALRVIRRRRS
ncbi:MAG: LPS biosynthesis glycosyltransferase, partial [Pseudomonadota bacterium]